MTYQYSKAIDKEAGYEQYKISVICPWSLNLIRILFGFYFIFRHFCEFYFYFVRSDHVTIGYAITI